MCIWEVNDANVAKQATDIGGRVKVSIPPQYVDYRRTISSFKLSGNVEDVLLYIHGRGLTSPSGTLLQMLED